MTAGEKAASKDAAAVKATAPRRRRRPRGGADKAADAKGAAPAKVEEAKAAAGAEADKGTATWNDAGAGDSEVPSTTGTSEHSDLSTPHLDEGSDKGWPVRGRATTGFRHDGPIGRHYADRPPWGGRRRRRRDRPPCGPDSTGARAESSPRWGE